VKVPQSLSIVKGIFFSPLAGDGVGGVAVVQQGKLTTGGNGSALVVVGVGGALSLDPDDRGGAHAGITLGADLHGLREQAGIGEGVSRAVVRQARHSGRAVRVADHEGLPAAVVGVKAGGEVRRVGHGLCSVALGYKLLSLIRGRLSSPNRQTRLARDRCSHRCSRSHPRRGPSGRPPNRTGPYPTPCPPGSRRSTPPPRTHPRPRSAGRCPRTRRRWPRQSRRRCAPGRWCGRS
jgi:hypothetical protein